jgi:hypothetical protein
MSLGVHYFLYTVLYTVPTNGAQICSFWIEFQLPEFFVFQEFGDFVDGVELFLAISFFNGPTSIRV